jgi:hypothetical protein
MHSLRLLQHRLSQLLVDQRALPRAGRPAAGVPLDLGQPRRGKRLSGSTILRTRSGSTAATPLTPPSKYGCRKSVSIRPSLKIRRHRPVRRLTDSFDAFLAVGKRSTREVAVILNRVPAVFDTAHIGFIFTDVIRDGHCGGDFFSDAGWSTTTWQQTQRLRLPARKTPSASRDRGEH